MTEITEGNKLIAEFIGYRKEYIGGVEFFTWDRSLQAHELWFHSSWDWLRPAFVKFKSMQLRDWETDTKWNHTYSYHLEQIGTAILHKTIAEAHSKLVEAIQWYNSSKQ